MAAVATDLKLVEQLKLLRDEWGEGFEEDVAAPLAQFVQGLRTRFEAVEKDAEERVSEAEDDRDNLSALLDARDEKAIDRKDILEDLADVERGVRTLEEVLRKWTVPIA